MEKQPDFHEKLIVCCECGDEFLFEVGEQAFFWSKKLSEPKRCPACRRQRKATIVADRRQYDV